MNEKGSPSELQLHSCERQLFFAGYASGEEWILPIPSRFDVNYALIDQWQPERLWTINEFVQAYKNNYSNVMSTRPSVDTPENGVNGGFVDLSVIPEVDWDRNGFKFEWFHIAILVIGLIVAAGLILFIRRYIASRSARF